MAEVIGYQPSDPALLQLSMAHRSWCAEQGGPSNERLEFLGDSVLGFVVAERVFADNPELTEGELTDIRKAVVNAVTLADVADELGLGQHLMLGKGEEQSGGREKPSILADAMEAVIGAVYVDGGMEAAGDLIERVFGDRIADAVATGGRSHDYKSRLQEELAATVDAAPAYEFTASGPDHARSFTAVVRVDEDEIGRGEGRSKKQAEQQAARAALESLGPADAGPAGDSDDPARSDETSNPPNTTEGPDDA